MTNESPELKASHTDDTGIPHQWTLNVPGYATSYAKIFRSFPPDTMPDAKFWNSDEAAQHFAELVAEALKAQASPSDHAELATHLYEVSKNPQQDPQQAINRMASGTKFASIAHKISEVNHKHGPGWGAWLAALLIPIVAPLGGQSAQPVPAPSPATPVLVEETSTGDVAPSQPLTGRLAAPLTDETIQALMPAGGMSPAPALGSSPVNVSAETPVAVTYNTAEGGQSLTITGPSSEVEVISNILRSFSPAAFNQLSPEQQHALAQRIFTEMGQLHSQQAVTAASARITLAGPPQQDDVPSA
jgi:hypothetical protein